MISKHEKLYREATRVLDTIFIPKAFGIKTTRTEEVKKQNMISKFFLITKSEHIFSGACIERSRNEKMSVGESVLNLCQ